MKGTQSQDSKEQLAQKEANERLAKKENGRSTELSGNKKLDGPNRPST